MDLHGLVHPWDAGDFWRTARRATILAQGIYLASYTTMGQGSLPQLSRRRGATL